MTAHDMTSRHNEPIPLSDLIAPAPPPVSFSEKRHEADDHGILVLKTRPTCYEITRMLPFPFLCVGCCCRSVSTNSDIIFNDNNQTITVRSWPGYMSYFTTEQVFEFSDVGNVAVEEVGYWLPESKGSVARRYFSVVLIMRDGTTRVWLTKHISLGSCEPEVKAVHRFLFGRHDPSQYTVPTMQSLTIHHNHDNVEAYPPYYKFYM
jgi:hypothetical protein